MENPGVELPYFNEELQQFQYDKPCSPPTRCCSGRVTYDGFKAAWPSMDRREGLRGPDETGMPKYVATPPPGSAAGVERDVP